MAGGRSDIRSTVSVWSVVRGGKMRQKARRPSRSKLHIGMEYEVLSQNQ